MTLVDLADAAEVTPRTVRYYIAQGLLPPPLGAGSAAAYTEVHQRYLKTINAFQKQHLPLAEIRSRLEQEPPPGPTPGSEVGASSSALDYLDGVLPEGLFGVRTAADRFSTAVNRQLFVTLGWPETEDKSEWASFYLIK